MFELDSLQLFYGSKNSYYVRLSTSTSPATTTPRRRTRPASTLPSFSPPCKWSTWTTLCKRNLDACTVGLCYLISNIYFMFIDHFHALLTDQSSVEL